MESQSQEGPTNSLQQSPASSSLEGPNDPLTTLAQRSVSTPPRKDARRPRSDGGQGSQRATRHVFNEVVCKKVGLSYKEDFPITPATSAKILERVRAILSNYNVARGEQTYTDLKKRVNLSGVKRNLERHFPVLYYAENQWAATLHTRGDKIGSQMAISPRLIEGTARYANWG